MAETYDVVVIGGGSGGYVSAIRLAQHGRKVAVVERDRLGGTCLHRGCIPTKIFLESAGFLARVRNAAEWGVAVGEVGLKFDAIAARKDRIVGANEGGIKSLFRANGVETIAGIGRLLGDGRVAVTGDGETRELRAADILIATGSRPKSLPGLEIDGEIVVTSDHVTHWTSLPESIVIAGAGAVGAEFASAMRDFGLEVTLVEFLPRILPLEDAELSEIVARSFNRRGINVLTGARLLSESIQRHDGGVSLTVQVGDQSQELAADRLLVAIGRAPVVEDLGLDAAGVTVERGAIVVDGWMQTSAPHVYACGDVVGGLALAHAAFAEGEAAVAMMLGKQVPAVDYNLIPRATYTRPEVASVGLTEEQARAAGREIDIGRFNLRTNPKAMIAGEAEGIVKIVADAVTGELVGLHLAGPHVTELIGETTVAKLLESTAHELAVTVHPHPTLSEAIAEAAAAVTGQAVHIPPPRRPTG